MKNILTIILCSLLLTACAGKYGEGFETFEGSDFSFSYPEEYDLVKAATKFVFEDDQGEAALTMYRYLADAPGEVIEKMSNRGQECGFTKGGTRYGGNKAFTIVSEGECELEGSLVSSKKGIMMLFIENDPEATALKKTLKKSFKFN